MGRLLGLTNRSIKLMVGDKDNRKWSIRGLDKQGGPKTQLFDESLEIFLRYSFCVGDLSTSISCIHT